MSASLPLAHMSFGKNRVVVLVEDDPAVRRMVEKHLLELGFEVHPAIDYHAAVRILEQCRPDLICLDITLPRESGFELCEWIRGPGKMPFIPILVMSERSSPEDMAHAEQVGANAYLKKPFVLPRFTKYLSTLLDGPHASRPSVRRLRRDAP